MRDGPPLHQHPDRAHFLHVLEGEMTAKIGGVKTHAGKGVYLAIPALLPHRYVVAPGARVLLFSMDSPPYDPHKTVRLEKQDPPLTR